jgi:hypothetical protein
VTSSASTATPPSDHHRTFGALITRHIPGVRASLFSIERAPYGLFLLWLAYVGVLMWAMRVLWQRDAWHTLAQADPTMITFVIVFLFWLSTLWAGHRAWLLGVEAHAVLQAHRSTQKNTAFDEYQRNTQQSADVHAVAQTVLIERIHGPHEMAWWVNGILLKLGLLGKVIGFSILAMELGQLNTFDPSQSAQLLKTVTGGLGIALLTTITGLTCNILLGLQLMRLDRFADQLLADMLVYQAHR